MSSSCGGAADRLRALLRDLPACRDRPVALGLHAEDDEAGEASYSSSGWSKGPLNLSSQHSLTRMHAAGNREKFQFVQHIGGGSFGEIFSGRDLKSGRKVAIKVETNKSRNRHLYLEYAIYSKYLKGEHGFPDVIHYAQTERHNYIVMTLLGRNLESLKDDAGGKFADKTLLMVAVQVLERIEVMHERSGFLHRDIKPENMVMGRGVHRNTLFLVDLGLAKSFISRDTCRHKEATKVRRTLTGTARYASINAHYGKDQSRRDDMQSIGYVLVYLAKGRLPWQGIKASNSSQRYQRICEIKLTTSTESLCRGLNDEFKLYLDYVNALKFKDRPEYTLLSQIFREAMRTGGHVDDGEFGWVDDDDEGES